MSYTIAQGPLAEARVAEFNSQHRGLSLGTTAQQLAIDTARFPSDDGAGFPYSGDHLGTYAHREILLNGELGDEIRRERIHNATPRLWDMVTRDITEDFAA